MEETEAKGQQVLRDPRETMEMLDPTVNLDCLGSMVQMVRMERMVKLEQLVFKDPRVTKATKDLQERQG